jgi:hypothetical protein
VPPVEERIGPTTRGACARSPKTNQQLSGQLAENDVHGGGENASHLLPALLGVLARRVGDGHTDDTLLVRKREAPSEAGAYAITRLLDVTEFYLRHVLSPKDWAGAGPRRPIPLMARAPLRSEAEPLSVTGFTRATPLPPWPVKQLALGRGPYANVPNLHRFPRILNLLPIKSLCT